jgi:DNA-binding response OmpR family regulator
MGESTRQDGPLGRLLIVDDDPAVAALLMKIATDGGHGAMVGKSNDGFESLVVQWQPTIIALDIIMPRRDGLELLRSLVDMR